MEILKKVLFTVYITVVVILGLPVPNAREARVNL